MDAAGLKRGSVHDAGLVGSMAEILFIDDDQTSLRLFSTACELLGHTPLVCDSGRAAVTLAAEKQPDLILLDLMLQDAAGLDVLRRLRKISATAGIPVVVLSASPNLDEPQRAQAAGAQGYLSKPVTLQILQDTIARYIAT